MKRAPGPLARLSVGGTTRFLFTAERSCRSRCEGPFSESSEDYSITSDPVFLYDLNATFLHLLGLDHTRLIFRFQGRDFPLTDIHGEVVRGILA